MRTVQIIAIVVPLLAAVFSQQLDENMDFNKLFNDYKKKHKKRYPSTSSHTSSFNRWRQRKLLVESHNRDAARGKFSFKMVDNEFADHTELEWKRNLFGISVNSSSSTEEQSPIDELTQELLNSLDRQTIPSSLDWRTHPCMPPVKLQSPCGSCWAFISTTSVEFQTCLRNNATFLPVLSEQQLIDCSGSYGTKGCNGGFYSQAWDYLLSAGGQALNMTYPYTASVGTCKFTPNVTTAIGKITKYTYLPKNETTIMQALQKGPVTVSLVTTQKFILYSSGIFDDDTCSKNATVNHGIVLVGYGTANNTDYWIARNSWGTGWGQNGHMLIKRNTNVCRIAEYTFLAV